MSAAKPPIRNHLSFPAFKIFHAPPLPRLLPKVQISERGAGLWGSGCLRWFTQDEGQPRVRLPGIDPEQQPLPGLKPTRIAEPIQSPLMAEVSEEVPEGQMRIYGDQPPLSPRDPEPTQLALLPDPPPWEMPDEPRAKVPKGRLSKKRSRAGITPGQTKLF
jgi:hypothetical protein